MVRLWDPDSGEQDLELRGHGTTVQAVVFSPDGTRLASVGNDGVVPVWLELDDLIAIAERRLTRSFTDEECRQFLDQDRCPVA